MLTKIFHLFLPDGVVHSRRQLRRRRPGLDESDSGSAADVDRRRVSFFWATAFLSASNHIRLVRGALDGFLSRYNALILIMD